jgi:hypothetical protein
LETVALGVGLAILPAAYEDDGDRVVGANGAIDTQNDRSPDIAG